MNNLKTKIKENKKVTASIAVLVAFALDLLLGLNISESVIQTVLDAIVNK
jgi:hypothetical protein